MVHVYNQTECVSVEDNLHLFDGKKCKSLMTKIIMGKWDRLLMCSMHIQYVRVAGEYWGQVYRTFVSACVYVCVWIIYFMGQSENIYKNAFVCAC